MIYRICHTKLYVYTYIYNITYAVIAQTKCVQHFVPVRQQDDSLAFVTASYDGDSALNVRGFTRLAIFRVDI